MTVFTGIAVLLGAAALLLWRPGLVSGPTQQGLRRLIRRLTGALIVLVPLGLVPPFAVVWALGEAHPLLPSALAGTVIATGWVVTFVLREYQGAGEREQVRIDTLVALRTEILTVLNKLDAMDLSGGAKAVQDRIADADPKGKSFYHPYSSSESPPSVFNAIADKTLVLNPETLEPVLRFYASYSDLSTFTEDFRSAGFSSLTAPRRIEGHKALTQLRRSTLYWALAAIEAVDSATGANPKPKIERSGKNTDIFI